MRGGHTHSGRSICHGQRDGIVPQLPQLLQPQTKIVQVPYGPQIWVEGDEGLYLKIKIKR